MAQEQRIFATALTRNIVPTSQIQGLYYIPMTQKRQLWYTGLVLATLKRSGDLTIGYVMANCPRMPNFVSIAYPWPRKWTCGTPTWSWPPQPDFYGQRAISPMPSTHPANMGLSLAAIWEEIALEQQDSLGIYSRARLYGQRFVQCKLTIQVG